METKKVFRFFSIFEHEKEQAYLRKMHKSGWKFTKVSGPGIYHFVKCTPEDVIYQLDYNQEGLSHREEYVQMFRDCGWEYLQDYVGYSYFRKPVSEAGKAEEIFCDNHSRMQMFERVFKGRLLPLFIIFSVLLVPQFIRSICESNYPVIVLLGAVIGLYIVIFFMFALQYWKYKK